MSTRDPWTLAALGLALTSIFASNIQAQTGTKERDLANALQCSMLAGDFNRSTTKVPDQDAKTHAARCSRADRDDCIITKEFLAERGGPAWSNLLTCKAR